MPLGGECSVWERWLLQYGGWLSSGILAALPSVHSPDPPTPGSPQAFLVHSSLCLPEPRVSGCKWGFVHWPFKRLFESPAVSLWQTETLQLFTAGCYLGTFCCYRLGSLAWGLYSILLRGVGPQPLKYLSSTLAFSCLLCIPYQSHCGNVASIVCLWI